MKIEIPNVVMHFEFMRHFGVRRLDAALVLLMPDRYQSGVKPPHSKVTPRYEKA